MISTLIRVSALIKSEPMPVDMANISAAITVRQTIPASRRRPVNILGKAIGIITCQRINHEEALRVRATFIYSFFTPFIPVNVLYATGKKAQIKIRATGSASLIPIHSIKSGSHPNVGIGNNILISGLKLRSTTLFNPIRMPANSPAKLPSKYPIKTLVKLAARLFKRIPLPKRTQNSINTLLKGGNNGVWAIRPDISHKARNKHTGKGYNKLLFDIARFIAGCSLFSSIDCHDFFCIKRFCYIPQGIHLVNNGLYILDINLRSTFKIGH